MTESPFFIEARVEDSPRGLRAVIRPNLKRIWASGSGNIEAVARVALVDAIQKCGEIRPIADLHITQSPINTGLQTANKDTSNSPQSTDLPKDKVAEEVWRLLREKFPTFAIEPHWCPLLELEIDSIEWLELLMELEEQVGISLSEPVAVEIVSIADLVRAFSVSSMQSAESPMSLRETNNWLLEAPENNPSLTPRSVHLRALGYSIYQLNRLLMRTAFRLRTLGVENLPLDGAYILAPNHTSDLDIPAVLAAIPPKLVERICWGGNRERLFGSRIARFFSELGHVIPVDDRLPLVALSSSIAALRAGRPLVWYAESWRSADGKLQPFMRGIGVLADATDVPIVPVQIRGTFDAWPRNRGMPKIRPISVAFSVPIQTHTLEAYGHGADRPARITDGLRNIMRQHLASNCGITGSPHSIAL